jgi:uncharacterized membrane protein
VSLRHRIDRGVGAIPPETALLRIGLVGAGALLLRMASQVATTAPLAGRSAYAFLVVALGALGLAALVAAGWRTAPHHWRWLILLAVVTEIALTATIWRQTQHLNAFSEIDVAVYTDMASELLLRGENPYAWDFNDVQEVYRVGQAASTPQLDGSITERDPYPALSFLAVLPFKVVGLPGVWLIPVLAQMALACLLFLAAPRAIQPLVLLPLVVWFSFSGLTAIGGNDIVWATLLVGMIVAWRRPTLRALLYGLAVSYKQIPWFLFPFLAIRIWRGDDDEDASPSEHLARVAHFAGVSGGTFVLLNLPFVAWDPAAWLKGVLSPMTGSLVYLSQGGLSGLTAFGYVDLPKSYYLLMTLAVLGLLLLAYWRHYAALRDTFVIMPAILTWFSYRTLVIYWVFWALPALAILIRRPPPLAVPSSRPRWLPTALVAVATLLALAVAGVLTAGESRVVVEPVPPYPTVDGYVVGIAVKVENHSDRALRPRFAVHSEATALNPLPWYIESGPLALEPGQSALYQLASNGQLSFPVSSPAQVVVTDAGGDYALRGVATIGPDRSFLWPDAIPNPRFLFWDKGATAPIFWGLRVEPAGGGAVSYTEKEGRSAVLLATGSQSPGPRSVALHSVVLVPRSPFGIWVYREPVSEDAARVGIEFADGDRRLALRFGARNGVEQVSGQVAIVERSVPAGRWTYQEIDILGLYRQVGWELPPLRPAVYRNVDADFRTVDMSLFLSSAGTEEARAYFGPIEQDDFEVEPEALMAETLDDPAGYYVRLSERYVSERNYLRAVTALERALELEPGDAAVSARLDEIEALLKAEAQP